MPMQAWPLVAGWHAAGCRQARGHACACLQGALEKQKSQSKLPLVQAEALLSIGLGKSDFAPR